MTPHDRHQFRLGIIKTLPLVLGLIPFGLAYGIVAVQAGFTVAETILMSVVVFAGTAQFMAVVMVQSGAGILLVIASTLLVNLRYLVMGLSLSPYLSETTPRWQRFLAFIISDESYLTSVTHYRDEAEAQGNRYFMLASGGAMYITWNFLSLVGALAAHSITDPLKWGLDFAMPATFLTMLLPHVVTRRLALVVVTAGTVATTAFVLIPGQWYIIVAVVAAVIVGVTLETLEDEGRPSC